MRFPKLSEVQALVREGYALNAVPDQAVARWMAANMFDLRLHARLGSLLALPENATVPPWASFKGKSWAEAGMRLLAPLCDDEGVMRSVVAQGVAEEGGAAVPAGCSHEGLLVSCPEGRNLLAGRDKPSRVIITGDFCTWLRWVERSQRADEKTAVWGVLPASWTPSLAAKIPIGSRVLVVSRGNTEPTKRQNKVIASLQPRVANGDVELRFWPKVGAAS
jgi:hypothetical protein